MPCLFNNKLKKEKEKEKEWLENERPTRPGSTCGGGSI